MRISFWGRRGFREEFAINPELFIWIILVAVVTVTIMFRSRAVGVFVPCQIWGVSIALGTMWIILFPHYFRTLSSADVILKSIFLLALGVLIILTDWLAVKVHILRLQLFTVSGKGEPVPIALWIWLVGMLIVGSGLLGLVLHKRVLLATQRCSATTLRLCAIIVLIVAVILVMKATTARNELSRTFWTVENTLRLEDDDPNTRRATIEALGQLGVKEVAPEIIKRLKDDDEVVRKAAREVLEKWGVKIPEDEKIPSSSPLDPHNK